MRYADQFCSYSELNDPHRYRFKGCCIQCHKEQVVEVIGSQLYLYRRGKAIQDALNSNSDDEREYLMTGICGKCFDEMFAEEC